MKLHERLEDFKRRWLSNPAAQLDFVTLIQDAHEHPKGDHANHELLDWLDDERQSLRRIGVKSRPRRR